MLTAPFYKAFAGCVPHPTLRHERKKPFAVPKLQTRGLVSLVRRYSTKLAERIRSEKLYVTDHDRETVSGDGIVVEVVSARDWLLEP